MLKTKMVIGAVALLLAGQAFAAQNALIRVINRSSYDVYFLYTSSTNSSEYGRRDLLGENTIRSGYNRIIDFNVLDAENNCVQDVQAKTKDGRSWTKTINVCTATEWTLRD